MAKITAHGEREIARWRYDGQPDPRGFIFSPQTLVLTQKPAGSPGRLLKKFNDSTGGYAVIERACTLVRAKEWAAERGFERV